jgi:hypothetical protein
MRCCFADSFVFILVCLVLVRQPSAATRRPPIHSCGATVATRKRRESFSGQVGRWTHASENPRNSATAKGGVGAESLRVRVEDVFADTVRVLEAYASHRGALKGLCLADGVRRKSATLALASKARSRPSAHLCVAVTPRVSLNRWGGGGFIFRCSRRSLRSTRRWRLHLCCPKLPKAMAQQSNRHFRGHSA